jgi:hypothetical protein
MQKSLGKDDCWPDDKALHLVRAIVFGKSEIEKSFFRTNIWENSFEKITKR